MHFGYEQRCRRGGPIWTEQRLWWWILILFRLRCNKIFRFREWVNDKNTLYFTEFAVKRFSSLQIVTYHRRRNRGWGGLSPCLQSYPFFLACQDFFYKCNPTTPTFNLHPTPLHIRSVYKLRGFEFFPTSYAKIMYISIKI